MQRTTAHPPQVTGLVAILLQADTVLAVQDLEDLLRMTSFPLGSESPNKDSGSGPIDAYVAAATAMQAGCIEGEIIRRSDGEALAAVQASELPRSKLRGIGSLVPQR